MLWLVDFIGACLLAGILFSKQPWINSSDRARRMRLSAGALSIGLALAAITYFKWPYLIWFTDNTASKAWAAFIAIPIICLALVFYLESLNKEFVAKN